MIKIDEDRIREEISGREIRLNVHESWLTPAGRERSSPMYEATVKNSYLGKSRYIKKQSLSELESTAREQIEKWAEQEFKARVKAEKENLKEEAEADWLKAKADLEQRISDLNDILSATIDVDDRLDWVSLEDRSPYADFQFPENRPAPLPIPSKPSSPEKGLMDLLLPPRWRKRQEQFMDDMAKWERLIESRAQQHQSKLKAWQQRQNSAREKWQKKKTAFESKQRERNESIRDFRKRYEAKNPMAVVEYLEAVFEQSEYPENYSVDYSVGYDPSSETAVVDLSLPTIDAIPQEIDFRLKKTTAEISPVTSVRLIIE